MHEPKGGIMLLIIEYSDGTDEALKAELEGGIVSHGRCWIPGILVQEPERCHFKSDFFEAALNEGHLRSGRMTSDPDDPEFDGFDWKLVGNEADDCREKMARWLVRLGPAFDLEIPGAAYHYEGLLRILSDKEATTYDRDRECWLTYLDDPASELITIRRRPGAMAGGQLGRASRDNEPTNG